MKIKAERVVNRLKPQAGPQTSFIECGADICVYGGSAGGGKSFGLVLDAARCCQKYPNYGAVIFRRTSKQVTMQGGLWDTSEEIMPHVKAKGTRGSMRWSMANGSGLTFAHLEHDKNRMDYQGAQIPYIGFDELTHFTESQFWYLISRNRSQSGGPTLVRATCNPEPDHFAKDLIQWWIDEDTGLPIPERSGIIRWFLRVDNELVWADKRRELIARYGDKPDVLPKSFTFIPSTVEDNRILLKNNPGYLANLMAQSTVDRERLRFGNWNVRPVAGSYFQRQWFTLEADYPRGYRTVRYWDRAATEKDANNDPCYTVGVKMTRDPQGRFHVIDVVRKQLRPAGVEALIKQTAILDGPEVEVILEGDPGSAGKMEIDYLVRQLAAYAVRGVFVSRDKETRAKPASCQAEAGNISCVLGAWTEAFLIELENFPTGKFMDQVDAFDGALNELALGPIPLTSGNYIIKTRNDLGPRPQMFTASRL